MNTGDIIYQFLISDIAPSDRTNYCNFILSFENFTLISPFVIISYS